MAEPHAEVASPDARCPFPHEASAVRGDARCPVGAERFDPFSADYLADPAAYVRWAREQQPVFFSDVLGYWVVTRHDDVKAVFRDLRRFSPANALEKITPPSEEAMQVLQGYGYAMNRTLVNEDEPAHMARRRLLLEPFTPDAIRHHEPLARRLAHAYVDRFIDAGRADLVDQMLWEVPLTIALHFLGVDEDDMPLLRRYSIAHTVNTWGRPAPEEQLKVAHAVGNFWQLAGRILDKMRADPSGPGWMKFGIRMQADHPDVVTDSYLHSMMMAGIVAAHETTANATANALRLLLENRAAWQALCDHPALIPQAVEECLRLGGSIIAWRRVALEPVTVGGTDLPAGAKVLVIMASANQDERHFERATELDIHRDNAGDHLSFGYGAHQCMGKNLARMELQVFLEILTRRLPHMQLVPQAFSHVPNIAFRGPEHLWVEWNVADNPERRDPSVRAAAQAVALGEGKRAAAGRPMRVVRTHVVAEGILEVLLEPAEGGAPPRWSAGAHIDVACGASGLSRAYSLCGDPDDAGAPLRIAVLREPAGRGGSAWIHDHLKPGDVLRVRGPRNHFRFDADARRLVLIAGGIGITPVMAMARRAKRLGLDYVLHHCGRSRGAMAFADELAAEHGARYVPHIAGEGGRADFSALLSDVPQVPGTQVVACGPARMLDALTALAAGWPEDTLRIERFQTARAPLDPTRAHAFEVELRDSGQVLQVPADRTLLDVLREANVDVTSDCGEGLCGSCQVPVLEGEVDHRDVVLTRAERQANGSMMACCSRAKGRRLVLEL